MRVVVFVVGLLCVLSFEIILPSSQVYQIFVTEIQKKNPAKALFVLKNWTEVEKNSPYYYRAHFEYSLFVSSGSIVRFYCEKPVKTDSEFKLTNLNINDKSLVFNVRKSNAKQLNSIEFKTKKVIDVEKMKPGLSYLKKGIELFPDNFEMRFLILDYYYSVQDFESYLECFESLLTYFKRVKGNVSLCCIDTNLDKKTHLFDIIHQNFYVYLKKYNSIRQKLFLHRYINFVIKYFPKNEISYADKAYLCAITYDDDNALKYYLKAYKCNKKDVVILKNIAATYSNLTQYDKSVKFYNKALKLQKAQEIELKKKNRLSGVAVSFFYMAMKVRYLLFI